MDKDRSCSGHGIQRSKWPPSLHGRGNRGTRPNRKRAETIKCTATVGLRRHPRMTDVFSKRKRSWIMRQIRSKHTAPERAVRSILQRNGFSFRLHKKELPGNPDIVLPRYRVVVQVQGCFWHGHGCQKGRTPRSNRDYWHKKLTANRRRDLKNSRLLRTMGWRRIVVWGCQTKNLQLVEERLIRLLRG